MKYLSTLKVHGVVILLVLVAVVNVLVTQKVLHFSGATTNVINVVLGALGVGVHVTN
jgi:hypothetical protein